MKRNRWILPFILLLIFAFILAACGGDTPEEDAPDEPATTEEEAAPEEEEAPAEEEEAPAEEEAPEAMDGAEIRFAYYADGKEADVMQVLVDDFMVSTS